MFGFFDRRTQVILWTGRVVKLTAPCTQPHQQWWILWRSRRWSRFRPTMSCSYRPLKVRLHSSTLSYSAFFNVWFHLGNFPMLAIYWFINFLSGLFCFQYLVSWWLTGLPCGTCNLKGAPDIVCIMIPEFRKQISDCSFYRMNFVFVDILWNVDVLP